MRIHHRFIVGHPVRMPDKCLFGLDDLAAVGLITGGLGAITSLFTTGDTNRTNKANTNRQLQMQMQENQLNRDWNTSEAEKARQFQYDTMLQQQQYQTSEREAQQRYQSQQWRNQQLQAAMLQRQGLTAAGINPAVAMGQGAIAQGGSVSAPGTNSSPSGLSGAQASPVSGLSPVPFQAQNPAFAFAQMAQGLQSLAGAQEKGVNIRSIEQQIKNMQVDENVKKVMLQGFQLDNALKKAKLPKELEKFDRELSLLSQDLILKVIQGKKFERETDLMDVQEKMLDALANVHTQQSEVLRLDVATYFQRLNSLMKLQGAQATEASAQAGLAREQSLTVKELRGWQVGFEQARAELAQVDSFVKRNTMWQQCESYLAELRAKEMLPEQVEESLRAARKANNWYEVNQILGIIDTGVKAYGTYKSVKTGEGFVDAQNVRNDIQSGYYDYLRSRDEKTNPYIAPGNNWHH